MKKWKIPVSWEMAGLVEIEAHSLEEAISIAENDDSIGLPTGDYIDASWRVDAENVEAIRECYNNNQSDDYRKIAAEIKKEDSVEAIISNATERSTAFFAAERINNTEKILNN